MVQADASPQQQSRCAIAGLVAEQLDAPADWTTHTPFTTYGAAALLSASASLPHVEPTSSIASVMAAVLFTSDCAVGKQSSGAPHALSQLPITSLRIQPVGDAEVLVDVDVLVEVEVDVDVLVDVLVEVLVDVEVDVNHVTVVVVVGGP